MSQLLVVFGATGQQGGSVANTVLSDPELSKKYKVRGLCRDISKPAAKALQEKGAEVVVGDLDDPSSLKAALEGAHTIFGMTKGIYDAEGKSREVRQGRVLADAAVASGAKYLIFSTGSHAFEISNKKYFVDSYDSKAEVEAYIRSLPIKSAFFAPATFMQNFAGMMGPKPLPDGTFAIGSVQKGDAVFPWLDVARDSGKFVAAILADPEKYEGQVLCAGTSLYSLDEVADIMSKATGKTIKYYQMPEEKYRTYLPPAGADTIVNMFLYIQDFGYYGPGTKEKVEWAAKQARGHPLTVEEWLQENPPKV